MKNIITFVILFFSCLCLSQVKEDKLDSIISTTKLKLNTKKIFDIFCISRSYFNTVGREVIDVETGKILKSEYLERNNFTAYVFWKENSKIYLQKFDYSNKFGIIELEDFGLFEIIKKNLSKILTETVLEHEIRNDSKKISMDIYPILLSKLHFYSKNNLLVKEFNEDHLVKNKSSDGKILNLNYKSNKKLKMIEIFNICKSKIEEINYNKISR